MHSACALSVIMLSEALAYSYAECYYAKCRYAKYHYAECCGRVLRRFKQKFNSIISSKLKCRQNDY